MRTYIQTCRAYIHACIQAYVNISGMQRAGAHTYIHTYIRRMQGKGAYTYGDGSRYVGMFKNDKRDGYGVYTYSSGDKYSGEWKVGLYVCMYVSWFVCVCLACVCVTCGYSCVHLYIYIQRQRQREREEIMCVAHARLRGI